jgi:PAS domain-containing protein
MAITAQHADREQQTANEPHLPLRETLDALLEITGATAGWIGLLRPDGQLGFPARAGIFSEAWLTLQQGQTSVWGFEVCEGPILLNELPPLAILGEPPLQNLLSCWLRRGTKPVGQLIVANKPTGFTSHDATALQTAAQLLSRQLVRLEEACPALSAAVLRRVLDQLSDGILIVDHTGHLIFANLTWAQWTGYPSAELCDRSAPFPFWVSHADLATLGGLQPALPGTRGAAPATCACPISEEGTRKALLPFRHRNHGLFWCQVETTTLEIVGQAVTIAFLRRLPADQSAAGAVDGEPGTAAPQLALPSPERTPALALLLCPGGSLDFWDECWEELTGLTRQDLVGVSGELFLDWLLPRQPDRDFVADLFHQPQRRGTRALLEVAGRKGNRRLLCTFLPVCSSALRQEPWVTRPGTRKTCAEVRSQGADAWLMWACNPETTRTGG